MVSILFTVNCKTVHGVFCYPDEPVPILPRVQVTNPLLAGY